MTELATPPVEEHAGVTRISHWIGGCAVAGPSGRTSPVYNPATGRQTGALDLATAEEVDQAVQAAKAAFESWRSFSLGLTITALPAAIAIGKNQHGTIAGKLNGLMIATTPSG